MLIGQVKDSTGMFVLATIEAIPPSNGFAGYVFMTPAVLGFQPEQAVEFHRLWGNALAVAQGVVELAA
jgi:hypothetical protein